MALDNFIQPVILWLLEHVNKDFFIVRGSNDKSFLKKLLDQMTIIDVQRKNRDGAINYFFQLINLENCFLQGNFRVYMRESGLDYFLLLT